MVTEEERYLVASRLKTALPEAERNQPITMIAGRGVSVNEAIEHVMSGTPLGEAIIRAELKKMQHYGLR